MGVRVASSAVAVSWIPSESVELSPRALFDLGIDVYDDPPPSRLDGPDHLRSLHAAGRFRTCNRLSAWIDVDEDGRITDAGSEGSTLVASSVLHLRNRGLSFAGVTLPDLDAPPVVTASAATFRRTAGGCSGLPALRRVRHPPFAQLAAPPCWTTLELTLHADGRVEQAIVGASPFPRHWLYDGDGQLVAKSGLVSFESWWREAFGSETPWGGADQPLPVVRRESEIEHNLSVDLMASRPVIRQLDAGDVLVEQGNAGTDVCLVLDGLFHVERDGEVIAEVGPGAIVGEQALFANGRRTATLRATTRARVAVAAPGATGVAALAQVAEGRGSEIAEAPARQQWAGRMGGSVPPAAARDFEEYYEAYLTMHRSPVTQWAHAAGWIAATSCLVTAVMRRDLRAAALAGPALAVPAWLSHALVEHSPPATGRPLWEVRADLRMLRGLLTGRGVRREVGDLDP